MLALGFWGPPSFFREMTMQSGGDPWSRKGTGRASWNPSLFPWDILANGDSVASHETGRTVSVHR